MYNNYFGFSEAPFGVTPDPQFYYSNAVYQEALANLHYGIEARKGFILITGEAGTGKTTLLRKALHAFGSNIKSAYLPNSLVGYTDLLRLTLADLGLPVSSDNRATMIEHLTDYLIEAHKAGNIVALLIDEAQNLRSETLEELRLLGNLETDKEKLLQVVLVGQPELELKLDQPELRQLKQRIVLRCQLKPVRRDEVGHYMDSRLETIGHRSADLFDPDAVERVADYSAGIPRIINIICDNALLAAFALSKLKISPSIIDEVAEDLKLARARTTQPVQTESAAAPRETETSPEFYTLLDTHVFTTDKSPLSESDDPPMHPVADAPKEFLPAFAYIRNRFRPMVGASAIIVLLVGFGAFSYRNERDIFRSRSGSNSAAGGANEPNAIDPVQSATAALAAKASTLKSPSTFSAPEVQAIDVAPQNLSITAPEKAIAPKTVEAKLPQPSIVVAKVPDNEKTRESARADHETRPAKGLDFLVVGPSFVRAKPTANAAIIATLAPGTHITVSGRTGEYFRIRASGAATIRGYVHKEDAFFERKS